MEDKTFTIKKVKFVDKWVVFWFKERDEIFTSENFDLCSKSKYIGEAVEKANLRDRVQNKGYVGLKVTWELIADTNWEIKSISK